MSELAVIGKGAPKRDGAEKVTGRTQFLHDLELPRLAHGAILRTPHPARAHRRAIDTQRGREALPGVLAVLTGRRRRAAPVRLRQGPAALKARQGALHPGRGRRGGRARRAEIAEEAVALIRVEYEELPAVFDPAAAAARRAPRSCTTSAADNLTDLRYQFSHGDVDGAFARGRRRRGGRVPAELRHHRLPGHDGRDRGLGHRTSGLDDVEHDPGAVPLPARPGRGARASPATASACCSRRSAATSAAASTSTRSTSSPRCWPGAARRPVKIAFERIEEFVASPTREPCAIRLRTAADRDGRLLGARLRTS